MPPRKQKKNMKKLADVLKECRISSLRSEEEAPVKDEKPSPGMLLDSNQNETKDTVSFKTDREVPPIFLHQPVDFKDHVEHLLLSGVKFYQPHKGKNYTKVKCLTFEDQRNLIKYSKSNKLPYHTYGNPTHRKKKVIIRGLPKNTCLNALKDELESIKIPVVRIHKMHTKQTVKEHPLLVLVVVSSNEDQVKLMRVKSVLGTEVKMEHPIVKTRQCHRCQKWGHSQRYCHGKIRCVKCAGEHMTSNCSKDPKTPPKCANCGEAHTASYKKCTHCPESDEYKLSQKLKLKDTKINKLKLVTLLNYKEQLYKNIISLDQLQDHSDSEPDYGNFEEVY